MYVWACMKVGGPHVGLGSLHLPVGVPGIELRLSDLVASGFITDPFHQLLKCMRVLNSSAEL